MYRITYVYRGLGGLLRIGGLKTSPSTTLERQSWLCEVLSPTVDGRVFAPPGWLVHLHFGILSFLVGVCETLYKSCIKQILKTWPEYEFLHPVAGCTSQPGGAKTLPSTVWDMIRFWWSGVFYIFLYFYICLNVFTHIFINILSYFLLVLINTTRS